MSSPEQPDPAAVARALPIYDAESEILDALREHRVVVLEGPTGSGKTTQLPRILLRAGYAEGGLIGITQPRRIAAVSVAHRIAAEEGVVVGEEVGYAIRFDDRTSGSTRIKVMTDGILLQEARSEPDLGHYSVVIIDEAHERSLNIDFCLGLLHRLIKSRDDLRIMVTSATMRPEEFQAFFADAAGGEVPRISINARVYPVKVAYRRPAHTGFEELVEAAATEVVEIHQRGSDGHVLVFLTGEGMIHQTGDAISRRRPGRGLKVVPLYGRLPRAEQERVFDDLGGGRKVVLATNIAETSITIPGVRHVIDCGLAKVPRFNPRTGITTLREEPISQASAAQRAGRAGRTAPGRVVRLYGRDDHRRMAEFTEEEIRRQDLTEVVLRLIDLGIRDVEDFPFPTRPTRKKLQAALERLTLLGAIDGGRRLTEIGSQMVPYPLSPSLARMVVEAAHRHPDVVDEVLLVAAFLSARPPFLFPLGEETEARRAHGEWANPQGDAARSIQLFRAWKRTRSQAAFCERHYLDRDIMAFVAKIHGQLAEIARDQGIEVNGDGRLDDVVRCVAAGFCDKIMHRVRGWYETETGERVAIHPGSGLFRGKPPLIVAAEIVVSSRTYARQVSAMKPDWLSDVRPDLARSWRMGGRSRRGKKGIAQESLPAAIELCGVRLKVKTRNGRPHIDVPAGVVKRLLAASDAEIDPAWRRWPSRIVSPNGSFAVGTRFGRLLKLLPHLPLPTGQQPPASDIPEGALLTVADNWSTLEWLLKDRLLAPAFPMTGKRPGWVAFVTGGSGTYWFEVMRDFPSAVQTSSISLQEFSERLPEGTIDGDWLEAALQRLSELDEQVAATRSG